MDDHHNNLGFIEKLPTIAILHVPNGYRNNFGQLKLVCCWIYVDMIGSFLKKQYNKRNK